MKRKITEDQLYRMLERLIEWDALEICMDHEKKEVLIPYLMNDATEYYLQFCECVVQGKLEEEMEDAYIEFVHNHSAHGLIIRQKSGNIVTIWYKDVFEELNCYQYHLIGHAWRRKPGEEFIRRLVNLICVIHDKVNYLGEGKCNSLERKIGYLAEFAPILYFTPINESVLEWYPESEKGIESAKWLAEEANDRVLVEEILKYEKLFLKGKMKPKQLKITAGKFQYSSKIWLALHEKICEASLQYPARNYESDMNLKIEKMRDEVVERYEKIGFSGEFPKLKSSNQEIYFIEEHPFTILESEDYKYRIFSMTREIRDSNVLDCVWREEIHF